MNSHILLNITGGIAEQRRDNSTVSVTLFAGLCTAIAVIFLLAGIVTGYFIWKRK